MAQIQILLRANNLKVHSYQKGERAHVRNAVYENVPDGIPQDPELHLAKLMKNFRYSYPKPNLNRVSP